MNTFFSRGRAIKRERNEAGDIVVSFHDVDLFEVDSKSIVEQCNGQEFMRQVMLYAFNTVRNEKKYDGICISTTKSPWIAYTFVHTMTVNGRDVVRYEDDNEAPVSIGEFFDKALEAFDSGEIGWSITWSRKKNKEEVME